MYRFLLPLLILLFACENNSMDMAGGKIKINRNLVDSTKSTVVERFIPVTRFKRMDSSPNSFGTYLRNLPLKKISASVKYYNGSKKVNNNIYISVIDQDIDPVDLQQCADAVMRLRGEYLFAQKRYSDIHFNFLSDGKPRYFINYAQGDLSYKNFRKYMKYIFSYANTGSLHDELIPVGKTTDIRPGDVFIQKKQPYGHAVIVVDVIENAQGQKKFLIAQSYMPAQETQVLINPNETEISPWYSTSSGKIVTPEWTFEAKDLHRFKD